MDTLTVSTRRRCQLLDVTGDVQKAVRQAGLKTGHVVCYVPHSRDDS